MSIKNSKFVELLMEMGYLKKNIIFSKNVYTYNVTHVNNVKTLYKTFLYIFQTSILTQNHIWIPSHLVDIFSTLKYIRTH